MSWLRNGTPSSATSNITRTVTVPVGTVASDSVLLVATGSTGGTPVSPTSAVFSKAGGGGTFTALMAVTQISNSWMTVWKATGLVAGDTITLTLNANYLGFVTHSYFDNDPGSAVSTVFNRGGVSGGTNTAPAITGATAGDKFIVVSTERTTVDGTTVTSRTNSTGAAVTSRYYYEEPTSNDSSVDISEFTIASGTTSGTTAVLYSSTSGNGGAITLKQSVAAPPAPSVGLFWPNSMEATAIRAGFQVSNSASTKLAVSTASNMAAPVKSAAVTTTDGLWHTARLTGLTAGTQYYVQLECDGVLTGPIMMVKTLNPGVPLSYKFLTGSCHSSGINAPIFDVMAADTADFFVHQGDLHYADTNVEATWRAAFLTNMNTSKFLAFRSKMGMDYQYDNHDWAGQGFEADDWDPTVNPRSMVKELAGEYPLSGNLYKTWAHGRVRFFHTDLWSERDDDAMAESSSKRCMSAAQETQFLADLAACTEPLIIWLAHWPLYTTLPGGRWGSYTTQRDRIKAWLDARPGIRSRMIAIGGDSHSVSSDSGANQTAFGKMPTLNASPFYAGGAAPSGTWDIVNYDVPDNTGVYSRCTITDDVKTLTFKWEAINEAGAVVSTATWTRKLVTPRVIVGGVERDAVAYVVVGGQEVLAADLTIV